MRLVYRNGRRWWTCGVGNILTHLVTSRQLCRSSGDRTLWDLPFWKVILRLALDGGWLKV